MKYAYGSLLIFSFLFLSCQKGKEMKTDSGFKYILYTESKGPKPKLGDYVTIILTYKNDKDSVLFDWKKSGTPIRFQLEKFPFKGSFEEGLTFISENDSATFYVPADSLYKVYSSHTGTPQSETAFLPGTYLKFDIKLLKVQTPAQAEEEMLLKQSAAEKKEKEEIAKYLSKNNIGFTADSAGYYLVIREKGKGSKIEKGKVITLDYAGKFLNDSVFYDTRESNKAYQFVLGTNRVIQAWELALNNLNEGDKITLLVPSRLAYGVDGLRDPSSATYLIDPNTPLVFEIDILKVEDMPAVANE